MGESHNIMERFFICCDELEKKYKQISKFNDYILSNHFTIDGGGLVYCVYDEEDAQKDISYDELVNFVGMDVK